VNAIRLVARREIVERTRERSFLIGTLVTIAIVAAVIVLPVLQTGGKVRLRAALKAGSGT
jgi:ABC-type Na+ efflux pump permease subunit